MIETKSRRYRLTQLQALESESIAIFREVVAECERPVLLFSGGKDSAVMLRLTQKAFWPAPVPFPVLHVDTGHNFAEVLEYRDRRVAELGLRLLVASVLDALARGVVTEPPDGTRNRIQTPVQLEALELHRFSAVFGGARRDEDKARAKERVFSFRDSFGQWDPKNQRYLNLTLLTDGLRAEREQGITIDVAYRYFTTPQRTFVHADTPGHHQLHPQHGHRRLHRRPRHGAGRCPERSGGTKPPARFPRHTDDLDVSRGNMICRPHDTPRIEQDIDAMVCWMSDTPLRPGQKYALKHTTRTLRALVTHLQYRLDVTTLHREPGVEALRLNDIGRVRLRTTGPLFCDSYRRNRITGGFILINESTNHTAAAGMIN